jgi:hypothetical protein
MNLVGDPHFVAVVNVLAFVWWGGFLAWSHAKGQFHFADVRVASGAVVRRWAIDRSTRPWAYWGMFSIFGVGALTMGLVAVRMLPHPL